MTSSDSSDSTTFSKSTVVSLQKKKERQEKIAAVTCYDSTMARLVGLTKMDMVLVGDSLGMVMMGYKNTLPVTIDNMVTYAASVSRSLGGGNPLLVGDMPFMSSQLSAEDTYKNAMKLMQEGGMEAVKIEGESPWTVDRIAHLCQAGVPVMGHLGFTPQSIHACGGFKVWNERSHDQNLLSSAQNICDAGAFALVLELVPQNIAAQIATALSIPVIGIGAGHKVDGQILVLQDLLGMNSSFKPKFVKNYCNLEGVITEALQRYLDEVHHGEFPRSEHTYS